MHYSLLGRQGETSHLVTLKQLDLEQGWLCCGPSDQAMVVEADGS